jgi:hypothetical protein
LPLPDHDNERRTRIGTRRVRRARNLEGGRGVGLLKSGCQEEARWGTVSLFSASNDRADLRHIQYFFLKKDGEMANQAEHFSLMYFKVEAKGQVFVDAVERYWLVYENQNLKSEYKDQARAAGFA